MKRSWNVSNVVLTSFALLGSIVVSSPLYAQAHPPLIDPIPAAIPASNITVNLTTVMSNLVQPTAGTTAPGDGDHLYIADQIGQVWSVDVSRHGASSSPHLFLDIRSLIVPLGLGPAKYDERGLLGIAFHPNFRRNHLFYTFSSQPVKGTATFSTLPAGAVPNCQNVLQEWKVMDMGDDNYVVDTSSVREVMRVDKPQFNHNGGAMLFGPDRLMYLSIGDGGGSNDVGVGHAAAGNAQTLAPGNVLGKILRIDPRGHNSANGQYGIPDDNPFVRSTLSPAPQPEIYAYGFRNAWRMSFDAKTGALYAGDVGQNDAEEVDIVRKGRNYGWPVKEGTFLFDGFLPGRTGAGYVWQNSPGAPSGLIDPIAQYDHGESEVAPLHSGVHVRQAVIGGFVYRGERSEALEGKYIFGDYGSNTSPIQGHLYVLRGRDRHIEELQVEGRSTLNLAVMAFAQGRDGELYLLASQTGTVLGNTGIVARIGSNNAGHDDDDDHGHGHDHDHDHGDDRD
ncbi:glucose/sorbosone dehydrogenase [Terriglobus roseus DSM 18391]|uniref:Glucose/sorbosone dehydrogenase n=1 Tax=Terriglobus roseus (strain DSM 18391 / NRRL B-41598 / KBS 63) TaxID=926566 RepID=I3ZLF4_TERRK|nr:PQQ-dependent sugar dehydrogenase [Terriglobus roseus]AFL90072.1 glucose/sorbosone dehydrogenase [Terriglobus roseus DSM 18391]